MNVIFRRYLPIIPQGPGEFLDGLVNEGDCFIVDENGCYIVSQARIDAPIFTLLEAKIFNTSISGFLESVSVSTLKKSFVQIDWGDGSPLYQVEQGGNITKNYSHEYSSPGIYEIEVYISG